MPDDFLAIDIAGLAELQKLVHDIPEAAADEGVDAANKYMLNVVRAYASYKYVTRAQAYPGAVITFPSGKQVAGWHSIKQFRYVMARIREGSIVPGKSHRTQRMSRGWQIMGEGRNSILANEVPYSPYVQGGTGEQARMHTVMGWKGIDTLLKERTAEIVRRFEAGVVKALKRLAR